MRFLLRFVVRLILLAVLTFGFVVLFEHGSARFPEGAKVRVECTSVFRRVGAFQGRERTGSPARSIISDAGLFAHPDKFSGSEGAAGRPGNKPAHSWSGAGKPLARRHVGKAR